MTESALTPEPIEPRQLGLGHLFDHVGDAVVVGDASSGRIVLWNATAENLFGYTRGEALGLLIEDLVPPELKERHRAGISRYAREGHGALIDSGTVVELPALHKDGSSLFVELTLSPIENSSVVGGGGFALAILRDVTARRDLESLRSLFVSVLAHDVRSPMASVLGFAEHLLQHGDEIVAEDRVSALQAIVRSAERVVRLAEDALLASALESGGVPVNLEPVIVIDAVREAFEPLEAMAEPHRFEAQIEPGLVVIADPHRLWQVLTNLLTNALKNSPPGTRVEIAADRCGESVEINVRDHGPGIAPELRDKLFERFSQLPGGEGTGSGLGLYICQQLLELIGGDISISDTTGTGSTFTIRLPAAEGA